MDRKTYIPAFLTIACVAAILAMKRKREQNISVMNNYFGNSEFTNSDTAKRLGIVNDPTDQAWSNLFALRDNILNPARRKLSRPIYITSGYRSPELNAAVGGASNSQHTTGEAVDITTRNLALNKRLFAILAKMNFDQLIWEKGGEWIHVSYRHDPTTNRGQMLAYNGTSYQNINNNWQTIIA